MGASGEYPEGDPIPVKVGTKRARVKGTIPDLPVLLDTPRTTSVAGGGNLSSKEAERTLKAIKALEMRAAGATYAQIAKRLGYAGAGPVYALVKRYLARSTVEGVAEMRLVQLDRLHVMLMTVWPKVVDPSHPQTFQALDRALSITDRITRMYGLDTASAGSLADAANGHATITNTITVGGSSAEVVAALQAMADRRENMGTEDTGTTDTETDDDDYDEIESAEVIDGLDEHGNQRSLEAGHSTDEE